MAIMVNALSTIKTEDHLVDLTKDLQFFKNGRDALVAGLHQRGIHRQSQIVFPKFYCLDVLQSVVDAGFNVILADIDTQYEYNLTQLRSILQYNMISAIVLVDFFGWANKQIVKIREICFGTSILIVRDCCHSPFTLVDLDLRFEIAILSWRKTIAVPDGGVLLNDESFAHKNDIKYWNQRALQDLTFKAILSLRSLVLRTRFSVRLLNQFQMRSHIDGLKLNYRSNKSVYPQNVMPSKCLLGALSNRSEVEKIRSQRRSNFEKISGNLKGLNVLEPRFNAISSNDVPYVVPLNIKDVIGMMKHLAKNSVQCLVWPGLNDSYSVLTHERRSPEQKITTNPVLCLPVHQDLSDNDIKKLVLVVKDWVNSTSR
jgi:dTDP-4-amino-4,6-dideoxygalactose transaminase